MRLIDADKILDALSIFTDKENGNKHFMYGIETAKEQIEITLEEQEGMQTKTEYLEAINRAIEGAKARLVSAKDNYALSKGSESTLAKKQRQVETAEITLQALEGMKTEGTMNQYCIGIDRAISRLAAYESTGLTPKEVKNLVAEVERLRQMFEPVCPKCGLANCRGIWKHTCDRCGADMREKTKK